MSSMHSKLGQWAGERRWTNMRHYWERGQAAQGTMSLAEINVER